MARPDRPARVALAFALLGTLVPCQRSKFSLRECGCPLSCSAKRDRANKDGGARRDRTDDLMLAKHALSQLSYGPLLFGCAITLPLLALGRSRRAVALASPVVRINAREGHPRCSQAAQCALEQTKMVGRGGLEPPTSRLSGVRSNHLSYRPISRVTR